MKQKIIYQLVNTAGEVSAIVTSTVAKTVMPKVARALMRGNARIEQAGFLNPKTNSFRMMGGELSVNGLLAAQFMKTGAMSIRLPRSIVRSIINDKVTLNGMTYVCLPNPPSSKIINTQQKLLLQSLAIRNPASGLIYYNKSSIMPLIYVRATNSYVWEQACGSGSIAYALFTGRKRIRQPSGKTVTVTITKTNICYRTSVWYDQKEARISFP